MQVDMQMQPKLKFEIVVSSEEWEQKAIETIQKAAYTGETGGRKKSSAMKYEVPGRSGPERPGTMPFRLQNDL